MKKKSRKDKLKYKNKVRKQQGSILNHERNILEPYAGVTDETALRMKSELKELYGVEHEFVKGHSDEKMSDVLMEYGKPFLDIINTENNL